MNRFVDVQHLEIGGHTDKGRRAHNEDAFLIDRELGLIVLADGVGGHQCGEVASAITCEVLQREIAAGADLGTAINRANAEVLAAVQTGKGKPGMGSTVVAVLLTENGYELAWVGDSRIYLWDGQLSLLTRDHSYIETLLASGQISMEQARTHPQRNIIMQAVGAAATASLDIGRNAGELGSNSCLLLCSDGITDPLDSAQLCQLLNHRTTAADTCERMVDLALQCGGKDNATAVLIAYSANPEAPPRRKSPKQVVWVYDPETTNYSGLAEVTRHHSDDMEDVETTQVLRVKPGTFGSLTPATVASEKQIASVSRGRRWRYGWLAVLLGMLVAGLTYWLY